MWPASLLAGPSTASPGRTGTTWRPEHTSLQPVDLPLFRSADKFKCGCGWPSFSAPYDPEHVVESNDYSHDMIRVEVCEARTGAHLGHVFDDGPPPTYRRYCINSAMLSFVPEGESLPKQIIAGAAADDTKQSDADRMS